MPGDLARRAVARVRLSERASPVPPSVRQKAPMGGRGVPPPPRPGRRGPRRAPRSPRVLRPLFRLPPARRGPTERVVRVGAARRAGLPSARVRARVARLRPRPRRRRGRPRPHRGVRVQGPAPRATRPERRVRAVRPGPDGDARGDARARLLPRLEPRADRVPPPRGVFGGVGGILRRALARVVSLRPRRPRARWRSSRSPRRGSSAGSSPSTGSRTTTRAPGAIRAR